MNGHSFQIAGEAQPRAACLFQETRLNIDPYDHHAVSDIPVTTSSASAFASRVSPKRRRVDRARSTHDEATFARANLASQSSIHFRPRANADVQLRPRSVLWRVLEDNRVLQLQPIDLYQDPPQSEEPFLTLRFELPDALVPDTVAFTEFANEEEAGALVVFAITQDGSVISLTLRREAFVRREYLENASTSAQWRHVRNISAFAGQKVYRVVPQDQDILWVSLIDGSLIRLDRQKVGNDYEWRPTHFTGGDWKKSFRGMIKWTNQATVKYGDRDLDPKIAITIVPSPSGRHVWTVCLDHTIRVWDVALGRVVTTLDLDGDTDRDFDQAPQQFLDPNQPQLLHFGSARPQHDDDGYTLISFSPISQNLRFWAIDASIPKDVDMRELYTGFHFRPPVDGLTGFDGWRLEQFHINHPSSRRSHEWRLWMLVRSGSRCQVLTIDFDANAPLKKMRQTWESNWAIVNAGPGTVNELKRNVGNPTTPGSTASTIASLQIAERWTSFLLAPGRFSNSVLETALAVYEKSLHKARPKGSLSKLPEPSLRERLRTTVGSSATMMQSRDVREAFKAYENEAAAQWNIYYGLVQDLQKQREYPLSLAYDVEKQVPWLVMADQVSSVRTCSQVEILWHNRAAYVQAHALKAHNPLLRNLNDSSDTTVGQLFHALSQFRQTFSNNFMLSFESAFLADALQQRGTPTEMRVQWLYERSGYGGKVSDDHYNQLTDALDTLGGFASLSKDSFDTAIELLSSQQHGKPQRKEINPYGCRTMTRGAQDTLEQGRELLLDMTLLIVFITVELVSDDYSKALAPLKTFENLSVKFKEYELLLWLANTPHDEGGRSSKSDDQHSTSTVLLESLFSGDWRDIQTPNVPEQSLLMYWIRVWTFGPRLTEQYDAIVPHIMAILLTTGDLEHANEFLRFLPDTAWALYVKARYFLMAGQYADAADCFNRAAPELSSNSSVGEYDPFNRLLQVDERNYLNDGAARFFQHVLSLFEKVKAMSYVADFARLALRASDDDDDEQDSSLKTDVLSRLFAASIHASRFEEAFTALADNPDTALRRTALHTLINSLTSSSRISFLLSLPFTPELAAEVDAYLSALCTSPISSPSSTRTPPHKILFAFRTHQSDHRGAALALYTHLQQAKARQASQSRYSLTVKDDNEIKECYLGCINALALVEEGMRWLLVRPARSADSTKRARFGISDLGGDGPQKKRRKVVTLDDVRREYQAELDRMADVEAGRYPLELEGGLGYNEDLDGLSGMPGSFGPMPMEVDVFAQ